APFRLFGQLAFRTQAVEDQRVARLRFQPSRIERPELGKSLIEELQLHFGIKNRHRSRKLVQRLGMALQRAVQLLAHGLHFGEIKAEANGTRVRADIGHVEKATIAMHDSRQLFLQDWFGKTVTLQTLARLRPKKLTPFGNHLASIGHIDRSRIGRIDPFDATAGIAYPDRLVDPVEKTAEELDTLGKFAVLRL